MVIKLRTFAALFAVIICIAFVSCSAFEQETNNNVLPEASGQSQSNDDDSLVASIQESLDDNVEYIKQFGGAYIIMGVESDLPFPGVNGVINLKDITDPLYLSFANLTGNKSFALKIFLDYKETEFYVDGELYDSYIIKAANGESDIIKFSLKTDVDFDNSHRLTVAVFTAPSVHFGEFGASDSRAGSIHNYEIAQLNGERTMHEPFDSQEPECLCDIQYEGLLVGTQFEKSPKVVLIPPQNIYAKPGEKVKLSYFAGSYPDTDNVLFMLLLDWKQLEINGEDYIYLSNDPEKIGYGTFEFTAPEEPGSYEVVGFIACDPFEIQGLDDNYSLDQMYRMTLVVEE